MYLKIIIYFFHYIYYIINFTKISFLQHEFEAAFGERLEIYEAIVESASSTPVEL